MNVKDFALVVVRLFGLWVLFECITLAERVALYIMTPTYMASDNGQYMMIFANLFDFIIHAAIGIMLVSKPDIIVDKLDLPSSTKTEMRLTTTNMMFLCFSLSGLVFLIFGLSNLIYHITDWIFAPKPPYEYKIDKAAIAAALFRSVIGLWLLFGLKGIIRGLRSLRRTGTRTQREVS